MVWNNRNRLAGGPLSLIATFMVVSAALRLGTDAAPLFAREAPASTEMETGQVETSASHGQAAPAEAGALLAALQEREATLERREAALEDRMMALQIAGRAIDSRMAELAEAEDRLRQTLALADGAAERDLVKLTDVYEQMKPKETARVFEQMEPQFAAGFLARMRSEVAAQVLAGMDPNAAYSVSVIMAGRNMGVPRR